MIIKCFFTKPIIQDYLFFISNFKGLFIGIFVDDSGYRMVFHKSANAGYIVYKKTNETSRFNSDY